MSLSRLDLNLFRVLDAVYAHGGISAAARHLHLSQSAVSHALARLRQTTGDPLLVRAGRDLVPTPRALDLRERVGQRIRKCQCAFGRTRELGGGGHGGEGDTSRCRKGGRRPTDIHR